MHKINFEYPDKDSIIFDELKQIANLDVNTNDSALDNAKKIIGYAHNLFKHNGDSQPSSIDPLTIIKEAKSGKEFRCVEYSLLANALLWAYGIPSRIIGLKTRDVETREYGAGHVVVEFWYENKWNMCDVQAGIIPTLGEEYLSALEFGKKIKSGVDLEYSCVDNSRFPNKSFPDMKAYIDWISEYLYFYDTPRVITFENIDLRTQEIIMLIPKDTKSPIMFQGLFKMNAQYTDKTNKFYVAPGRR